MRWLILFVFIGTLLTKNVTSSKIHEFPANLAWLFGSNDKSKENRQETRTVCQTEECRKIAKVILESRDISVDPCDDFYEYACGKWEEHNPIPEGSKRWSLWHMIRKNIERQIQDILDVGTRESDLLAVKLAKNWYAACTDTDAMDKQGLAPLISTLSRIGGWPMTMDPDEWDEQNYSWQRIDNQYARLMGRNVFHDVRVIEPDSNETKLVHIDIPHLPPNAYVLLSGSAYDSDEIENEDSSDEKKQDEESNNSPELGSGYDYDDNDDDDDDNNDENDDDHDDDSDEHDTEEERDNDEDIKKKKLTNKLRHKKNRKLRHSGKNFKHIAKKHNGQRKRNNLITEKNNSHKTKRQKIKKRTTTTKMTKRTGNIRVQRSIHRNKLSARKNKRMRKTLNDVEMVYTEMAYNTTTVEPYFTTNEAAEEDEVIIRQKYANYISRVARAIVEERGITVSGKNIDKDIEDMIEFQLKLTKLSIESGDDLKLTLDEFQTWYHNKKPKTLNGKINWIYKITELFDEAGVTVDGDLNIEVGSPDYFEALVSLLDETSSRTIVNYIHWNFLSRIIKTTTSEMRKLYETWEEVDEEDEKDSRSSNCIKEVEMSDILSYEYVRKYFSDDIAKNAMDMIDDIQKEVEYQIKDSDWMDEDTKDFVLSKLTNMKKFVGYPNWYRNSTIVKRYFQGLIIGKSYYENTLSYKRYIKWNKLQELMDDDDTDDEIWWVNPVTLNAFFNPQENSMIITAADFQSPFFAYGRPRAINFGIIGFLMAHEVNHGFDETGHLYDKNGDFMKWLSAMAQAYSKRAECFVEQFNNYSIEKSSNKKLENYGNQTADENIADTMGLQAVFRAYQRRERECGKSDVTLPGLEQLTDDQLFFLSFANLWCEAVDSSLTMQRAKMDEHSTGRLRVIGSVSNSEDFAKAYNCPVGSAMNPEKKCNIWK